MNSKNYLIYDADCGFCQRSVNIMKKITADKIDFVANYEIEDGFYGIEKNSLNSSIKFFEHCSNEITAIKKYKHHEVHPDAIVYHGAYAIFKALNVNCFFKPLLFCYHYLPLFALVCESVYKVIAQNRAKISKAIGADSCKIK